MCTSFVYVLRELGCTEVRYVGQSENPKYRFYSYANGSDVKQMKNGHPRKTWLSGLLAAGAGFEMEVIEECHLSIITEREQYWMDYYRALGHRLTNQTQAKCSPSPRMRCHKSSSSAIRRDIIPMSFVYRHIGSPSLVREVSTELITNEDVAAWQAVKAHYNHMGDALILLSLIEECAAIDPDR